MTRNQIITGRIHQTMNFNEKIWALTTRIPTGKVTTYGHIAHKVGTTAYRAVGSALGNNPYAPQVPCHRVVGHDGSLTGFTGGLAKKRQLLKQEGVAFRGQKVDPAAIIAVK